MTTGYNIREGSQELARRRHLRAVTDHDREVAAAILTNAAARQAARQRRSRLAVIAGWVSDLLATPTPRQRQPW